MKVHLIKRITIEDYILKNARSRASFEVWFSIIKSKEQYDRYCNILEDLVVLEDKSIQDEIELLTLLIEKWDDEHNSFNDLNPIELLKAIMTEHNLKATDLVDILGLSKGTVSKILNCHKGLSKDTIRVSSICIQ